MCNSCGADPARSCKFATIKKIDKIMTPDFESLCNKNLVSFPSHSKYTHLQYKFGLHDIVKPLTICKFITSCCICYIKSCICYFCHLISFCRPVQMKHLVYSNATKNYQLTNDQKHDYFMKSGSLSI